MRAALGTLALLVLAGCATPQADLEGVARAAGAELRADRSAEDRAAIDRRVAVLLAAPLDAEAAVQLALLNHGGLQARFAALDVSVADAAAATRLPNPGFSFGRTRQGEEREIERGLHLNLVRLLLAPWMAEQQQRVLDAQRLDLVRAVLDHAVQTRQAWIRAVAAGQSLHYARQVMQAAEASAELARRMQQVGNFSALQRAREQAFYADAALNVARAEQQQLAARERLTRQLGLWGEAAAGYRLPERLPDLPEALPERPRIEAEGLATRLDVQAAQRAVDATAAALGLARGTRWVSVVELGLSYNSSNEAPVQRGWEIDLELPIFDLGGARVERADAVWRQALHRAAEVAVDARSQIREAAGQHHAAWTIARHHRTEIVPLRARIAEQNLLRYNGMLIGVFELLADARAQIASVAAAMEAERDFWLADAALQAALVGPPPTLDLAGPSSTPAAAGGDAH